MFMSSFLQEQERIVVDLLNQSSHLLLLDNLESITSENMAIGTALGQPERNNLLRFLKALKGGKTKVLLGSRGPEEWLKDSTFAENVYELGGLDLEAAAALAYKVIHCWGGEKHLADPNLDKLLERVGRFPLPIEIILSNLKDKQPIEILTALQEGDIGIDPERTDKTESIVQCIAYSHQNLDEKSRELLLVLAPFTAVFNNRLLNFYFQKLAEQPELSHFDFGGWDHALSQAVKMGLLAPAKEGVFYEFQPTFPFFLRSELQGWPEKGKAIEAAFVGFYQEYSAWVVDFLNSKEADDRSIGFSIGEQEMSNLQWVVELSIREGKEFFDSMVVIYEILDYKKQYGVAIKIMKKFVDLIESSAWGLERFLAEWIGIRDRMANSHLQSQNIEAAVTLYLENAEQLENDTTLTEKERGQFLGVTYHQLGRVKEEQRDYASAESYYQKALEIKIQFKDLYSQAGTYHQLGNVKYEQGDYTSAESYYQKAV